MVIAKRPRVNRFDIWRGVNKSIASRIFTLVSRLRIEGEIGVIGGVARNQCFVALLQQMLGGKLIVLPNPQVVGALGAAIIARGQ